MCIRDSADLAGIERGGYKLVYANKPNASELVITANAGPDAMVVNAWYSIGLRVGAENTITDLSLIHI